MLNCVSSVNKAHYYMIRLLVQMCYNTLITSKHGHPYKADIVGCEKL